MARYFKAIVLITLFLTPPVYAWVASDHGRQKKQQQQLLEITDRNRTLRAEVQALKDEVLSLKANEAYLEKVARQELGWIRPGEVIYRVGQTR